MQKRGYHDFRSKFFVSVTKILLEQFGVSENFRKRKNFLHRGYHVGEYHDFLSKIFCLTVPKNFVEPFCFKKFLASKSFMQRRGISLFSVEFFCPTMPKKFCRPKNSGIENFHASEGRGASWFCRNFCFTGPKNFVFLCFRNFLVWTKIYG